MERLTYDCYFGDIHWWHVKGAGNLGCRQVCEEQEENGCKGCPIELAFDRLAAYEDTGLAPEEVQIQKEAMESMGWFGKMFQRYKGDPRGRIGTLGTALGKSLALLIAESAKNRQPVKDVDGNTWLPMLLDEFESMAEECEYNGQPDCALPDGAQCPHGVPTVPPVTNADKIRAMSDEELADLFLRANFCKCCEHNKDGVCNYICAYPNIPLYDGCIQAALTWMKQPVEEEA